MSSAWAPAVHVLTEPDHLAAIAAVGLLAGQRAARRDAVVLLGGFVAVFAAAFGAGAQLQFAFSERVESVASAATLVASGLAVAVPKACSLPLGLLVVLAAAAVHGFANGAVASSLLAAAGAGGAAALVALAGAALAAALRAPWGLVTVRVLGSWAAALGLILAGLALR